MLKNIVLNRLLGLLLSAPFSVERSGTVFLPSAWATGGCGVKRILSGRACSHKEKRLTTRDSQSPAHDDGVFNVFVLSMFQVEFLLRFMSN